MFRLHGKSKHPRDGRRNRGGRRLRAGLENGCQPATSVDPCMSGTGQNENPSSTPPIPLAAVASVASGQMVAATPSRVMNSRRLMADPVVDHKLPHCATQQNWLSMAEMGQSRRFPVSALLPLTLRKRRYSRADMAALTLGATSRHPGLSNCQRNAAPQRAALNLPTVPRDGETQSDGLNS